MFDYLTQRYGRQDILAITDLAIVVLGGDIVNGRCNAALRKAIASSFAVMKEPEDFVKKFLYAASVHEIGHIHGLVHHLTQLPNGKYCAMGTLREIAKRLGLTKAVDQYNARDNQFCNDCETYLKNANG